MLVAAVAWEKMDQATRDRAGELLKLNPMYSRLTSDAPSGQEAEYAFILASIWPDIIKFDDGYTDDRIDKPTATQNIGYADHLRHRYWHYKDLPFSTDGTPTERPPEPNAETQICIPKGARSSSSSDDVKSYDIVAASPGGRRSSAVARHLALYRQRPHQQRPWRRRRQ
jgi:hypothetical protein